MDERQYAVRLGLALCCAFLTASSCQAAESEWYLSVYGGTDHVLIDFPSDLKDHETGSLGVGFGRRITPWLAARLDYSQRGIAWDNLLCGGAGPCIVVDQGESQMRAWTLSLRPEWRAKNGFGVHGMLGLMRWSSESTSIHPGASSTAVVRGYGLSYWPGGRWRLFLEWRGGDLDSGDLGVDNSRYDSSLFGVEYDL